MHRPALAVVLGLVTLTAGSLHAAIPLTINHQGLVKVGGEPFTGSGMFKFGFVDAAGDWLWTNDGTHVGEAAGTPPDAGVTLPCVNGIYNVRLGDAAFANMVPIPSTVFDSDTVKLRILFNDGTIGWETLSPDQPVTSAAYAYHAAKADDADTIGGKQASEIIPSGVILMWSGSIATIPAGFALCDGTNGTPDLRDRFVVGAAQDDGGVAKTNVKGTLLQTGGAHEHTLSEAEMPSHTHTLQGKMGSGVSTYSISDSGGAGYWTGESPELRALPSGGSQPHENTPPFYALAFIMKQ